MRRPKSYPVTYDGKEYKSISSFYKAMYAIYGDEIAVSSGCVSKRIRNGMTPHDALFSVYQPWADKTKSVPGGVLFKGVRYDNYNQVYRKALDEEPDKIHICYPIFKKRIKSGKYKSVEDALYSLDRRYRYAGNIKYDNKDFQTFYELYEYMKKSSVPGVESNRFYERMRRGWDANEAFKMPLLTHKNYYH